MELAFNGNKVRKLKFILSYVLEGYGIVTRETVKTIKYAARVEGLILDPVYTAKAMYGLIDLIRRSCIERNSRVVFIHTAGTPIVFQYAENIVPYL